MVVLNLFETSPKDQTLRTLTALFIIIFGDILYLGLNSNIKKFTKNKLAYLSIWLILAIVFGVSVLHHTENDTLEINNETIKDHAYYGILVGILVYIPLMNWMLSAKQVTPVGAICDTAFGILLCSVASLITFLISVHTGLFL